MMRDRPGQGRATDERPLRIAVLTSLYPNSQQPRHGVFVEERLRHLVATGQVEARVIAPVPWFHSTHPRFGRYAKFAAVPAVEYRYGIEIHHPRYLVIPRVGMALSPVSMARSAGRILKRLHSDGFSFDLIDAHYFYPDGVAAARLARRFERPLVITARGTDINIIPGYAGPRRRVRKAAAQAGAVITVSAALSRQLEALGVAETKIELLRNGVDLARFKPVPQDAARQQLGISAQYLWLTVGNLVELKGVAIAIRALVRTPDTSLLVVGTGSEENTLKELARALDVEKRVHFAGHVDHADLAVYYSAADTLVHPSRSEGMPNVVFEALACGAAVIATPVGGVPEIITGLPVGRLMHEREPDALVDAWTHVRAHALSEADRTARRAYARRFDWAATSQGQLAVFDRVLAASADGPRVHDPVTPDSVK